MSIVVNHLLPDETEMNSSLIELKIPTRRECVYTNCYCEENVWKLCDFVKTNQSLQLSHCYAIFISNSSKSVPLWCQQSGNADSLCIWDYHVIFVYHSTDVQKTVVYDLDSTLPFPVHINTYLEFALRSELYFQPCFQRLFRVIPANVFLNTFASDRSYMKKEDGSWVKPPPSYPCIRTENSSNNIKDFISMDQNLGVGQILTMEQLNSKFTAPYSI